MGTGVSPKRITTGKIKLRLERRSCHLESASLLLDGASSHMFLFLSKSECKHSICPSTKTRSILGNQRMKQHFTSSLRKEVIQPHLPIRLPCYDFTPVIGSTFGSSLLAVGSLTSGISDSHGVTGGVYKTRERIHRDILIRDY